MRPRFIFWLLLLWALARPSDVRAEPPGILLGKVLVLHPSLTTEVRYDSNVFYTSNQAQNGLPDYAFMLRVLPGLSITTPGLLRSAVDVPRKFTFRLNALLDYREYLSPNPLLTVHRSVGGELGATLSIIPIGPLGLDVYDNYYRTTQPPYSALPYNFNRNLNVFGVRGHYAPGGGRLMTTLTLELGYDGYQDVSGAPKLSDFDTLYATATLRGSWKFLPKTALYVDVSQGIYHYLSAAAVIEQHPDSAPLRVGVGIQGLITPRLALQVFGGYGNGFYASGPTASSGLVQAEVRLKPTYFNSISLSYHHDFVNSMLGSYFNLDSVSLSYSHSLFHLMIILRASWDRMAFQGSAQALSNADVCQNGVITPCTPQLDRVDNLITAEARVEYPLREWLLIGGSYTLTTDQSNGYTQVNGQDLPVTYVKHEAGLRMTVRY